MSYNERKKIIKEIEKLRGGRTLVSLCNFDRQSNPELPGLTMQFDAGLKECLYRILKESPIKKGIDIFLYTRGGDTNSVWPIACLLREFDSDFEVLVPFRAHSAGTMLALAARRIVMTKLGELSPIDPTTGNQFNPIDPAGGGNRLGISVEDLRAYQDFVKQIFDLNRNSGQKSARNTCDKVLLQPFIQKLTETIHPLALGNVHRVHQLVSLLAKKLMAFHNFPKRNSKSIVDSLTVKTYSHLHMVSRKEAIDILGSSCVQYAGDDLEAQIDTLLKKYEDDFRLRSPLFGSRLMGTEATEKDFRFIGGLVETRYWGYLFETKGKISQHSKLPDGVTVQVPPGQPMPIVPGLPRELSVEINEQRWHHNIKPEGVTT